MDCLIIDDDKLSRVLLEKYSQTVEKIDRAISYSNAIDAYDYLKKNDHNIGIIYLDIEMPDMNGIEFLKLIESLFIPVVVVSSQDKYALEAICNQATYYLVKPVSISSFIQATEQVIRKIERQDELLQAGEYKSDEIYIKTSPNLTRVYYDDIIFIESVENYVSVVTEETKHTLHNSLNKVHKKIPMQMFLRIHRSYIINRKKIKAITPDSVILDDNIHEVETLPIGQRYKEALLNELNFLAR